MKHPGLVLIVCVLLAGCAPGGAGAPKSVSPFGSAAAEATRISGTVASGPVCPVQREPPDPGCAPRPVANAVVVAADAGGQVVARTTSGADGSYTLLVGITGPVVVTALPVAGLMGAPAPVTLTLGSSPRVDGVNFEYDTGIR
jgi:hypothetical protein